MIVSLKERDRNGAHIDCEIFIDGTPSGIVRLWNEEMDSFNLFIEMWNMRQKSKSNLIGSSKGHLPKLLPIEQ